jgi:hypothetical protein
MWAASTIASYPPHGVEGTVRAMWAARDMTRAQAVTMAPALITLGNLDWSEQAGLFKQRSKEFRTR